MVEVHGWITLRYSDYDTVESLQNDFVWRFKSYLAKKFNWILSVDYCKISSYNGLETFAINALHNHPGEPFYPVEIFSWVAKESSGSYGLLYFYDDESAAYSNEFQVFTLKRGRFEKMKDTFLSPYKGELTKEYDENNPPLD